MCVELNEIKKLFPWLFEIYQFFLKITYLNIDKLNTFTTLKQVILASVIFFIFPIQKYNFAWHILISKYYNDDDL